MNRIMLQREHALVPAAALLIATLGLFPRASGAQEPSTTKPIHFTDVTADSGINFTTTCGRTPATEILEVNGGGLALLDYDNDGDLDLFVANGATLEDSERGPGCRFFENISGKVGQPSIQFRDATKDAGISITRWAFGANAGDFDGDGFDDIFVSCFGPNILLRNTGKGTFEDVTQKAGLSDDRWSSSASWGDIDNDGDLDLYVTNYLVFDPNNPPPRDTFKGVEVMGGPHGLTPQADFLYENLGDGTFRDITNESGCGAARPSFGLNVVILDFDRDGWQDIYVANDSMPGFLFRNRASKAGVEGNGARFEEIGAASGIASNADGANQAAMGVAFADVDGNGFPDKFTTVFSSDTNPLHLNMNGTLFEDRSQQYGLAMISRPYLGWACGFFDFDHDGDEDLMLFNGHVYPNATKETMDSEHQQPPLLFSREGKRFKRVPSEVGGDWLARKGRDRCAAWGDLDNDGDIDVIVGEINGPIRVLRNDAIAESLRDLGSQSDPAQAQLGAPPANWLMVSLKDDRPSLKNRRGIGSVIELTVGDHKQTRWLYSGGSFQSSNGPYVHFGIPSQWLDGGAKPQLTVIWPDGTRKTVEDVTVGQHLTVTHAP